MMSWGFLTIRRAGREIGERGKEKKKVIEETRRNARLKEKAFTCDGWYGCDPTSKYEFRSSKSIIERLSRPESPCVAGRKILP